MQLCVSNQAFLVRPCRKVVKSLVTLRGALAESGAALRLSTASLDLVWGMFLASPRLRSSPK